MVSPASAGVGDSWAPVVSELKPDQVLSTHGSDAWATVIWGVPAGFIESRSLLQYGELPLWDRYGHAGATFIGQAVTGLGDPLQLIVILGGGSAGAWDVKFLAAKFLFCAGFGLLVWRVLGSQRLGLIFAALSAYCGAFFYINSHPVFFVFCYSPWILLSALNWLDPQNKQYFRWGLVWLLANLFCFNAGHVEAAAILIGGLNLAAFARAFAGGWARIRVALRRLAVGTPVFFGLAAPVWMSFAGALAGAYTAHAEPHIYQLPWRSIPGAFDDLFYQLLFPNDTYPAVAPGASLLVLAGCVLTVLHWRKLKGEPFFWINTGAVALWAGCIFGLVPAVLLNCIPLLNREGHTYTDFSYLLVIHLTLQSAFGFFTLAQKTTLRRAVIDFAAITATIIGLVLLDNGIRCRPVPWNYVVVAGIGAVGAPMLFVFLKARTRQISIVGWLAIILLGVAAQHRFGLYASGNKDLLLLVGPRLRLDAASPAIERIKRDPAGPFRTGGIQDTLYGDYAAVYELEDIRSCSPLTSGVYMDLVRSFPGFSFRPSWFLDITNLAAAQPLLNLLNVKYLLCPKGTSLASASSFRVVDRSDFTVIENPDVWPRGYFTDRVIPTDTLADFIQHLAGNPKTPFAALSSGAILSEPGLHSLQTNTSPTVIAATRYQLSPNTTAFDIHAPSAGLVCLSENQARGFIATANGQPKPILTVNQTFKALYLDQPGDYHVVFTYRPWHWKLACALFWIMAVGTALTAIIVFKRARGKTRSGQ
jgi:hypothetical protein